MQYKIIGLRAPKDTECIYLKVNNWNDYGFYTAFDAYYGGEYIGIIRVAQAGMDTGVHTYKLMNNKSFNKLEEPYYSAWSGQFQYKRISELNKSLNINVFEDLNDIAYRLDVLEKHLSEEVMRSSLLRDIGEWQCRHQLHRIAMGGAVKTEYKFFYANNSQEQVGLQLDFSVIPDQLPPTNLQILIGRNGIGKTHMLKDMAKCICGGGDGCLKYEQKQEGMNHTFAGAVCVSFNPFDDYSEIISLSNVTNDMAPRCTYIGLDRSSPDLVNSIGRTFIDDLKGCIRSRWKRERFTRIIKNLDSDPVFSALGISQLLQENDSDSEENTIKFAAERFSKMSSGHKCVLSILTSCINQVEECSIVLLDEPENHLHPPLLSAFISALSLLLSELNGVAIISTHSPVVLQEVPRSCVWMLNRDGDNWDAWRPDVETFGTDINTLTSSVFRLEVTKSGFHKLIQKAVEESDTLDEVFDHFDSKLGNVADGIARVCYAKKREKELNG